MSFLQLLQLHLDPHLSDSLSPEVDLGVRCCSWVDGRFTWGGVQDGFRKLTRKESYALVRRLKKSPSVTLLNLYGHAIEKEMILEFVNPIAALSDLQVLAVPGTSTYPPYPLHPSPPYRAPHLLLTLVCRQQARPFRLHCACWSPSPSAVAQSSGSKRYSSSQLTKFHCKIVTLNTSRKRNRQRRMQRSCVGFSTSAFVASAGFER
jgi:hypothetical protein